MKFFRSRKARHEKICDCATNAVAIPFHVINDSILIQAQVLTTSGYQDVGFILDTGDAIGPVFNATDAARLGLLQGQAINVSGAGGLSQNFMTTATIKLGSLVLENEVGSLDSALQGPSLLGLPFFLKKSKNMDFDFPNNTLYLDPR